jgi:hypothetical protein
VESEVRNKHITYLFCELVSQEHSHTLFISFLAVTPIESICDQLLYEKFIGEREIRNIKYIWIERDPVLVQQDAFVKIKNESDANVEPASQSIIDLDRPSLISVGTITSFLLGRVPPGETTDAELEEQYADTFQHADDVDDQTASEHDVENSTCAVRPPLDNEHGTLSLDGFSKLWSKGDTESKNSLANVLDMQVYLTGNTQTFGSVPFARYGRPDIKAIFEEMKEEAIASGDRKVAVCVSAPHKLMSLCHRACVLYSDDKVRFDFHEESNS